MLPLIGVLLSFNAIYALVPLIVILILIAAAAGLTRGMSVFQFLGFGNLLGYSQGMTSGRIKGITKAYGGSMAGRSPGSFKGSPGARGRQRLRKYDTMTKEKNPVAKGKQMINNYKTRNTIAQQIAVSAPPPGAPKAVSGKSGSATPLERSLADKIRNIKIQKRQVLGAYSSESNAPQKKLRFANGNLYWRGQESKAYWLLKKVPIVGLPFVAASFGNSIYSKLRSSNPMYSAKVNAANPLSKNFDIPSKRQGLAQQYAVLSEKQHALEVKRKIAEYKRVYGADAYRAALKDARANLYSSPEFLRASGVSDAAGKLSGESNMDYVLKYDFLGKATYVASKYGQTAGAFYAIGGMLKHGAKSAYTMSGGKESGNVTKRLNTFFDNAGKQAQENKNKTITNMQNRIAKLSNQEKVSRADRAEINYLKGILNTAQVPLGGNTAGNTLSSPAAGITDSNSALRKIFSNPVAISLAVTFKGRTGIGGVQYLRKLQDEESQLKKRKAEIKKEYGPPSL